MIKWDFVPGQVTYQRRAGDRIPHLKVKVMADDKTIGYVEVHLHRHLGRDRQADVSFGFTAVVEQMPS